MVLLLLGAPLAAPAAPLDGGTAAEGSEGGSLDAGLAYFLAAPVETPVPQLEGGGELAAGIDPAAVGDLIHPASLTDLKAALRRLGGPFEGGKTSVALQLNPYLVTAKSGKAYDVAVNDREHFYWRALQDSALSASVTPGGPFKDAETDQSHFTTMGFGATVELLGMRSPFSQDYQRCIDEKVASGLFLKVQPQLDTRPANPATGNHGSPASDPLLDVPPQPAADANQASRAKYEASVRSLLSATVHDALQTCNASLATNNALFVSAGGRWVLPGTSASDVDRVRVQREFAAVSFDLFSVQGFELAVQGRALGERPAAAAKLIAVYDGGLSVTWASKYVSLSLQATKSAKELGMGQDLATLGGLLKLNLRNDLSLTIGVQGKGAQPVDALQTLGASVSVIYRDSPVFNRMFPLSGVQK